ncbi:beta family protein [Glutamicibacter sp. X7]
MYYPILRGKAGEFEAWKNVGGKNRTNIEPLFELVAASGVSRDLAKFREALHRSSRDRDLYAIDLSALPPGEKEESSGLLPFTWLASELSGTGIDFHAVIHLNDTQEQLSDAITAVGVKNLILRIREADLHPDPAPNDQSLQHWCTSHELTPADVAIMIDLGSIYGADIHSVTRLADASLGWALNNGPWESIILASGASPEQISHLQKQTYHYIDRNDAELWNQMHQKYPDIDYADYGTRSPEQSDGSGYQGPLPYLRYATANHWVIWREPKDSQGRHSTFFDVCHNVVAHQDFSGTRFSWGDKMIANPPGPGAATQWISYAQNHHIELVSDRLTSLGVA